MYNEFLSYPICSLLVQIEQVNAESKSVHVLFVDYGNSATVPINKLKLMPISLLKIPQLAVECHLSGIRPISTSKDGTDRWSEEATSYARKHWLDKNFIVKVSF